MLKPIRAYFFEKEKKKRLAMLAPVKNGFNRERKNHYGLLLDASNPEDRHTAIHFAEELRREGNRVKILGFVPGKIDTLSTPFDVFTSDDLSKVSGVPKSMTAESFMDQPFDVLINLSIRENHKPLEYISIVSKASFRIGPFYRQQNHNPYDLCVDADEQAGLKDWINELMHTLQKIY